MIHVCKMYKRILKLANSKTRGKRPKKSLLLVSFFFFFLHSPRPTLISCSSGSPHHNQSFYTLFHDARFLIYIFGMKCETTLLEQEEPINHLPVKKLRCYLCGQILGNIRTPQKYQFRDGYEGKKQACFRHITD